MGSSCTNSLLSVLALQGRPQEVFGAFAAFREKCCLQQRQQQEGAVGGASQPKGGAAQKLLGSSGDAGSGVSRQRLLVAAEVLHILRPVAYALALRRWVPPLLLLAAAAAAACRCCRLPLLLLVNGAAARHCCRPSCAWQPPSWLAFLSSHSSVPSCCPFRVPAACRWGRVSWRPWLLSLSIDLLSMQLGSAGAGAGGSSAWFGGVQPANLGPSLLLLRCLQQTRCGAALPHCGAARIPARCLRPSLHAVHAGSKPPPQFAAPADSHRFPAAAAAAAALPAAGGRRRRSGSLLRAACACWPTC